MKYLLVLLFVWSTSVYAESNPFICIESNEIKDLLNRNAENSRLTGCYINLYSTDIEQDKFGLVFYLAEMNDAFSAVTIVDTAYIKAASISRAQILKMFRKEAKGIAKEDFPQNSKWKQWKKSPSFKYAERELKNTDLITINSPNGFLKEDIGLEDNESIDFVFISVIDLKVLLADARYLILSEARVDYKDVVGVSDDDSPYFTFKVTSANLHKEVTEEIQELFKSSHFDGSRLPLIRSFQPAYLSYKPFIGTQPKLLMGSFIGDMHQNPSSGIQVTTIATPCPPYWRPGGGTGGGNGN